MSLRDLLAAATPGPWSKLTFGNASTAKVAGVMASFAYATSRSIGVPMTDLTVIDGPAGRHAIGFTGNGPHSPENAALIVAAVNALPALLDCADALRFHNKTPTGLTRACLEGCIACAALARLDEATR